MISLLVLLVLANSLDYLGSHPKNNSLFYNVSHKTWYVKYNQVCNNWILAWKPNFAWSFPFKIQSTQLKSQQTKNISVVPQSKF